MNKVNLLSRFIAEGRVSFFWQCIFFFLGAFITWVYVLMYLNMDEAGLFMMFFIVPMVSTVPFFIYYACQHLPMLREAKPVVRYMASLAGMEFIFLTIYAISLLLGMSKMSFKSYIIWRADEAAILLFNSSIICAAICSCIMEMVYNHLHNNTKISSDNILDDGFIEEKKEDNN